ncbi:MAG TPA: type II secretion system minor pseudopilin GspK [Steroidobacteraceae bacterium]|nr:type II secretion system minor pseudopilin GspK [Pseudomonadota bacterium]HVC31089.1 type II secretion system minor pseudopilin GspK [Steroidobacteraceae bacterium]
MSARHCESGHARRRRRDGGAAPRQRQRGVALLVAILLVALGTIIAAAMAYDNAMTARRAAASFDFDQALLTAQGAEALAAYGLQQSVSQNAQYIYPGQRWSQPLQPTEVMPGVMLQASMEDLQGRFNINDLLEQDGNTPNQAAITAFQRLLTMVGLNAKWADYLVDWIDKNSTPMFPDGAEDSVYMEMNPPYRTPNLPVTSTSELMALPGFTRADFDKLAPYITALPLGVPINLCSASGVVLDALSGVVQYSSNPGGFEKDREAAGGCFPTQAVFLSAITNQTLRQPLQSLTAQTSAWFRLTSFVGEGSTEFAVYSTMYLEPTHQVRVVMRSFTPN